MTYDGINYLASLEEVENSLRGIYSILDPGGVFLFDQSTPANSINNLSYFDDDFTGDGFSYTRTSSYNEADQIHTTRFVIRKGDSLMTENHLQRAFTRMEMVEAVKLAGFSVIACLEAFEFESADDGTERIQWVLTRQKSTNPGNT